MKFEPPQTIEIDFIFKKQFGGIKVITNRFENVVRIQQTGASYVLTISTGKTIGFNKSIVGCWETIDDADKKRKKDKSARRYRRRTRTHVRMVSKVIEATGFTLALMALVFFVTTLVRWWL